MKISFLESSDSGPTWELVAELEGRFLFFGEFLSFSLPVV